VRRARKKRGELSEVRKEENHEQLRKKKRKVGSDQSQNGRKKYADRRKREKDSVSTRHRTVNSPQVQRLAEKT